MKKKIEKNGSFCNLVYFVRVTDFWFEQICGEYYTVVSEKDEWLKCFTRFSLERIYNKE